MAGWSWGQTAPYMVRLLGGGGSLLGQVFRLTLAGEMTTLVSFTGTNGAFLGARPYSGLTQGVDGALYGTTASGGSANAGTVFRVTTNGTFKTLISFAEGYGVSPFSGLLRAPGGTLYGVCDSGSGNVSGCKICGSGNTMIWPYGSPTFPTAFNVASNSTTRVSVFAALSDTGPVRGQLVQGIDGALYGTMPIGGNYSVPSGGDYTVGGIVRLLPNSAPVTGPCISSGTFYSLSSTNWSFNTHGSANPCGGLVVASDGSFFGTTTSGGISNAGTIFRFTTNKTFTTLASFSKKNGANPYAGLLVCSNDLFYGVTTKGGAWNYGTVFRATTNGTITLIASLDYTNGANPFGSLVLGSDGALYGTARYGGTEGGGSVFRVDVGTRIHSVAFTGTNLQIRLKGLPATAYGVARADDLSSVWQTIGAVRTDERGSGIFTDTATPLGGAFYRLVGP